MQSNLALTGLPKIAVNAGLLAASSAEKAILKAKQTKKSFVTQAISDGSCSALSLARLASEEFGLPLLDLDSFDIDNAPLDLVSNKLIANHRTLPLQARSGHLFVAVADPTNLSALDDIKFQTGLHIDPIIVEDDKLDVLIERNLDQVTSTLDDFNDADLDNLDLAEEDDGEDLSASDVEDAPVVRFVHKILLDGINKGASDIHFEPYERQYRVRYRIDGILSEAASPPAVLGTRIAARIKVMSKLDIAERRLPQDGRIKLNLSRSRSIDFRVNTLPTIHGEKVVMRILDPTSAQLGIEALGFEPAEQAIFMEAINRPWGMILVTGPTGSGKTVSLYTGLNILNRTERNISTAEDPVEIQLSGINQVNVHPKIGFTFASALRAFLRQDPDVVMVGEIRDLETAEIAIKAAQTGHLVLSTLHTNDAPQTLNRLMQMGVPAFNIASSVSLIIAQRLARKLCEECKERDPLPIASLVNAGFSAAEAPNLSIYRAKGCEACNSSGFKGRVGLFQVMPISSEMERMILENRNAKELSKQATIEGVRDLRRAGLEKVRNGITSLEEIYRVTTE